MFEGECFNLYVRIYSNVIKLSTEDYRNKYLNILTRLTETAIILSFRVVISLFNTDTLHARIGRAGASGYRKLAMRACPAIRACAVESSRAIHCHTHAGATVQTWR